MDRQEHDHVLDGESEGIAIDKMQTKQEKDVKETKKKTVKGSSGGSTAGLEDITAKQLELQEKMEEQEHDHVLDGENEGSAIDRMRAKQEKKNMKKAKKKAAKSSAGGSTDVAKQLELQEKVRMLMNQIAIREAMQPTPSNSNSQKQKDMSSHKFWSTQPVPKHGK